jgi:hypothetical protein
MIDTYIMMAKSVVGKSPQQLDGGIHEDLRYLTASFDESS